MRSQMLAGRNVAFASTVIVGVGLFGFGLRSGGLLMWGITALILAASLLIVTRIDLVHATLIATCACVFLTAMEPVHVGPLRLRGAVLIMALILAALSQGGGRLPPLPWWIWTLAGAVFLSSVLLSIMPPISPVYLTHRFNEAATLPAGASGSAIRIILSVIGIPTLVVVCSLRFKAAPVWIAIAYISGNALSGLAAYTDYLGITSLSNSFGGCGVTQSRACGFAEHPVLLTIGTVYATGMAAWFLVQSDRRSRVFGATTVIMLILGTYASGTRGGELSAVFAVIASVLLLPQYRRHLHVIALVAASAVSVLFIALPDLGHQILVKSRLIGSQNTSDSNSQRLEAIQQGFHDFQHSPVYGIGMHVILEAHNGYLQSLAAGGLIFFLAIASLHFGALVSAVKLVRFEPFALALVVTALTRVGYDLIEGALVAAVSMVPVALIAGLLAQRKQADELADVEAASKFQLIR